jgi:gluconokinase
LIRVDGPLLNDLDTAPDANVIVARVIDVIDRISDLEPSTRVTITHIVSCAFWHSLVGIDFNANPSTELFTLADSQSRAQTARLKAKFDENAIQNRVGVRFHSSFWPAKLSWLRHERPEVWSRTTRWLSVSDLIQLKLCGDHSTSISMASASGIFNQRVREWDNELLQYLRLKRSLMPPITNESFELLPEFKERWPSLKDARWIPSIGDGVANNIGSNCHTKNRATLMVGTTGAMRVAFKGEQPKNLPAGLWCYRVDERRVLVGGALSDGGGLYAYVKKTLNVELSSRAIGEEIARRGADAHGLTVMPFFFGERSTGYHENARGYILGLNASNDAVDILQAAMEAVAFRFAEIFDQLKKVAKIEEIIVSGGALDASPVWTQIVADVLGRNLLFSNEPEASLRGAVLLALESLGKIDSIDSVLQEKGTVAFHPKCHAIYKKARKRHISTYNKLFIDNK